MPADDSDGTEPNLLYDRRPGETPAEAVVTAVAEATGHSPLEMAPLGETLDPDALDHLFERLADGPSNATVTLDYCNRLVTVTADAVQVVGADADES